MNRNIRYHYYVEGECEKKLIDTLKVQQMIIPGKSEVFNPIQDYFNYMHIRTLPPNSVIILVFDTDIKETSALVRNLSFLRSNSNIREVLCIPQVLNLEDELVHSTNILHIRELLGCKKDSEFKQRFLDEKHLFTKLKDHHFHLQELWAHEPDTAFTSLGISNGSSKIKLRTAAL